MINSEMINVDEKQQKVIEFLKKCGVSNIEKFMLNCQILKDLLEEENSKYNLTRITADFDYWNKHVADSASMGLFFKDKLLTGIKIADIGCGAGFPSIILAIAFPKTSITAIDSTGKKTDFVRLIKEKLKLDNLSVITGRARELKLDRKFDIITARAVGEPIKIFKESKTWLIRGGMFILYQTPTILSELNTLNKLTSEYKIRWETTEQFTLPGGEQRLFLYCSQNLQKQITDKKA